MSVRDYRPGYHFSPRRNWMSDPNGLVCLNDVYHMFFQHNPKANAPGNMSWGHASSPDLVHWIEHPVAIPYVDGEEVYSGSIVIDDRNSAGFGVDGEPPLVAIYTSAFADGRQAQSLAFSLDSGMSWSRYHGNPVLDRGSNSFRDPKVFWYPSGLDGGGYWVMVAVEAQSQLIVIYRSEDLKRWSYLSSFGPIDSAKGLWECPDLFPLEADGQAGQTRWILLVSINPGRAATGTFTGYVLGHFDGVQFKPATPEFRRLDWGNDLYAAATFANTNGRRILVGWMSNWNYAASVPTSPWRGTMSLPRELSLSTSGVAPTVVQRVPMELKAQEDHDGRIDYGEFELGGRRALDAGRHYRLDAALEPLDAARIDLELFVGDGQVTTIVYDVKGRELTLDRTRSGETDFEASFGTVATAPLYLRDGLLRLQVFVDRTSVEVFAQGGQVCMTSQVFAADDSKGLAIVSVGGMTRVRALELTPMGQPQGTQLPD